MPSGPSLGLALGQQPAAVVICPVLPQHHTSGRRSGEARLQEIVGLAEAIHLEVRTSEIVTVRRPNPHSLFGKGQVERLAALVAGAEAGVVIIDFPVTPIQQKNLEIALSAKIVDRTGLILEIFGERAATAEGRLQVELAHLEYQSGRLVRSWTHLERQRGGYGFLGGPGETQIETDRRLLRQRIAHLKKELVQVKRTRSLHRNRRSRTGFPVVALVGYTNAGKSTLFNRLTGAKVMAENLLFATLDPSMRQISLAGGRKAILSDTVGFISDLPTELVAAFRATLEEVVEADLILHVRDIAHPESAIQKEDVETVLATLGVLEGEGRTPLIEVWNKADLLPSEHYQLLEQQAAKVGNAVLLSGLSGDGVENLLARISDALHGPLVQHVFRLHPSDGQRYSFLHTHGEIIDEQEEQGVLRLTVRLSADSLRSYNAL